MKPKVWHIVPDHLGCRGCVLHPGYRGDCEKLIPILGVTHTTAHAPCSVLSADAGARSPQIHAMDWDVRTTNVLVCVEMPWGENGPLPT